MGLQYRKRARIGRNSWVNLSTRGVSVSKKIGRVTLNSRGHIRVRIAKGLFWRP